MTTLVLAFSLVLQAAAAVLALRLIRITGRGTAWLLIAAALALMAVRRGISFAQVLAGTRTADPAAELVALGISALMVAGIAWIAPLIGAIRRAEREVRQLVEAAPDAMVIADEQDRIALVNAQAVRLFDWSRHDLVGRDTEILFPERFREDHRARRAKYRQAPRPRMLGVDEEIVCVRKDGTEFPAEISVSPFDSARGRFVVSSVRDISARREAAKALEESQAKYRTLLDDVLDSSADGVCIVGPDGRIVWVNKAFEGHFGLHGREVIGFDAKRIVHDRLRFLFDDPVAFGEKVTAALEKNSYVESFECRMVATDDREEVWLHHRSHPIKSGLYQGGRIEHYADITERKQAENRIRLFAQIARNMQMGLLVYRLDEPSDDRSLRVIALNPEGERLLGAGAEQFLGKRIDEAFPDLRRGGVPSLFADVIRSGTARVVDDFRYDDGRMVGATWSFKAFPLPDDSVGVVFESTEARKRTEELIRTVAQGVGVETGDAFFRSLVLQLAKALGLDLAMVGELLPGEGRRVRSLAMCVDGAIADDIVYDLEGAPCGDVVGRHPCCHPEGVAERFPDDAWLREVGAECYVGAPLFDQDGDPLGLIAVLGRQRLENPEIAESVVRIFAARAAAEIERRRAAASR
jgi:PAS domain S-box-containing protein